MPAIRAMMFSILSGEASPALCAVPGSMAALDGESHVSGGKVMQHSAVERRVADRRQGSVWFASADLETSASRALLDAGPWPALLLDARTWQVIANRHWQQHYGPVPGWACAMCWAACRAAGAGRVAWFDGTNVRPRPVGDRNVAGGRRTRPTLAVACSIEPTRATGPGLDAAGGAAGLAGRYG